MTRCLDQFEPGGSSAHIDEVFADLADFLPGFLDDVLARQAAQPEPLPLEGPFPSGKQEALGRKLMAAVGFDFDHGRLDVSLHPFCGGVPDDVRITTRYDEGDFMTAIMGVLHETGHAMYERGLPADWRLQPVGEARGMAMHESQSLMVEMQACRSAEFVSFLAPLARDAFGGGPAWEAENLLRHYNRVKPDFIRVDADEVTYPAHVILRYRLEKALIAGEMELAELPGEWNEGLKELLGITPPDDRLGCLQDIHWYDGAWGYFPTYTLGAMTAAQLFAAAKSSKPGDPRGPRPRRLRPADGLAEGEGARTGVFRQRRDHPGAGDGRAPEPGGLQGPPEGALSAVARPASTIVSPSARPSPAHPIEMGEREGEAEFDDSCSVEGMSVLSSCSDLFRASMEPQDPEPAMECAGSGAAMDRRNKSEGDAKKGAERTVSNLYMGKGVSRSEGRARACSDQ